MKTYNYYCDESTHLENDGMPYMLLGYVSVPYHQMDTHKRHIKELKAQHGFSGEIKWGKVMNHKHEFYLSLIDYFFASDLCFRAIVINKNQVSNQKHVQTHDDFYYKMYYQLIYHKLDFLSKYNIYIDIKDTLSAKKVKNLKDILQTQVGVINNLQNIHSKESVFMQLADLLTGAINYHLRGLNTMKAKTQIITRIKKQSNLTLNNSTSKHEQKLNLFFIELS